MCKINAQVLSKHDLARPEIMSTKFHRVTKPAVSTRAEGAERSRNHQLRRYRRTRKIWLYQSVGPFSANEWTRKSMNARTFGCVKRPGG